MQRPNFFLRTKLLPPRAVSELLERPRLTEKLRLNLNSTVTMVAADAGCGKTTLIADFIRNQTRPAVWYQLDHTDADPIVFLGYIAQGIKNFAPDFGETIFPYLSEANEDLVRYPERAVDLLLNEILQTIEQPFILVLDDYHHIGRETIVHQLVDRLLQYSSDMLHLIITTRDLPPLAIMRRRSQSAALVITREDLLFTDDEVRDLFRRTLNVELKDEEIAEYRNRTHGWITALQLVRQMAEQEIHSDKESRSLDLNEILQQSEKDIFDYFAEEVFSREPEDTQKLLLHLSLLESMPLDVCSRLFPDLRCSATLPELAQKNVFLTAVGEGNTAEEYRFHPLFRDFLIRRFRSEIRADRGGRGKEPDRRVFPGKQPLGQRPAIPDRSRKFRPGGADHRRKRRRVDRGRGLYDARYLCRGRSARIPRKISARAASQGRGGPPAGRSGCRIRALPACRGAPARAKRHQRRGRGPSLAREPGAAPGPQCRGFQFLEKAEKLAGEGSETFLKCANTRGLCLIAEGDWTTAEQQFRYALELAEWQGNEHYSRLITHNLALPAGFRGDFGEALRWFKRIFREGQPEKQLPQEAVAHLNVARLHIYRGEFDETERHLERALELTGLYNLRLPLGEIFETYANFYREKSDFARAGEFYERALKAYEEAGIDIYEREFDEERARFYLAQGDTGRARGLLENLIEARGKFKNETGIHTARLCLCTVKLAEGKTDGLAAEIGQLIDFFHEQNHYYDEALASMLLAETHFAAGERKKMAVPLQRALDLSARFDYEYWLRGEIQKNPALFKDEEVIDKLPPDLREELGAAPTAAPARDRRRSGSRPGHRSDDQGARPRGYPPRCQQAVCAGCLDHAARPRHLLLHRYRAAPPGR